VRVDISETYLFLGTEALAETPTLLIESDGFGVLAMSPEGFGLAEGGRSARLIRNPGIPMVRRRWGTQGRPPLYRAAVEFDDSETRPMHLGLRVSTTRHPTFTAIAGPFGEVSRSMTADVTGLRAIHTLRVAPRNAIVHLFHSVAPHVPSTQCEIRCPDGQTAQGIGHCLDCETPYGTVRICC
jgi:hypothetical protein